MDFGVSMVLDVDTCSAIVRASRCGAVCVDVELLVFKDPAFCPPTFILIGEFLIFVFSLGVGDGDFGGGIEPGFVRSVLGFHSVVGVVFVFLLF